MTNTGGAPPGWYHAEGDPEGTQRYWDGGQWIGEPQVLPPQPPPAPQPPATSQPTPDPEQTVVFRPGSDGSATPGAGATQVGFDPPAAGAGPDYSSPGAAISSPDVSTPGSAGATVAASADAFHNAAAPDYTAGSGPVDYGAPGSGAPAGQVGTPGHPAEWGTRAVAFLIDWGIGVGILVAGLILAGIGGAIADALGWLILVVAYLATIGYSIWNWVLRQGTTGQSIGKGQRGIKLVKDETGQPVGAGMALVRYLIASLISTATCGIYGLLDVLWPLWDQDKKRLTDKIVNMSVVMA
jgi:uncharacterized RDD family membrane protein YckC